jgi:hypothetical protein
MAKIAVSLVGDKRGVKKGYWLADPRVAPYTVSMHSTVKHNVYLSELQGQAVDDLAAGQGLTRASFYRVMLAFYFQSHGYELPGRVE